jgi:hypothetical protein
VELTTPAATYLIFGGMRLIAERAALVLVVLRGEPCEPP